MTVITTKDIQELADRIESLSIKIKLISGCQHIFTKGKRCGQLCGKKLKDDRSMCYHHMKKDIYREEIPSSINTEHIPYVTDDEVTDGEDSEDEDDIVDMLSQIVEK